MDVFEKARELGNMLLETKEGKKFNDKKYILNANEDSKQKLYEYNQYREMVYHKINSDSISEEELAEEQERLKEKIAEVTADPIISDMLRAEDEFTYLVNSVMNVLRATIEGEDEEGCSGNCSGCHGCG